MPSSKVHGAPERVDPGNIPFVRERRPLKERVRQIVLDKNGGGPRERCAAHPPWATDPDALTTLERRLREWGLFYGIAFGLERANDPFATDAEVAARAMEAAIPLFVEQVGHLRRQDGGGR